MSVIMAKPAMLASVLAPVFPSVLDLAPALVPPVASATAVRLIWPTTCILGRAALAPGLPGMLGMDRALPMAPEETTVVFAAAIVTSQMASLPARHALNAAVAHLRCRGQPRLTPQL